MNAEGFLAHLVEMQCFDGDTLRQAGFTHETVRRVLVDPVAAFQTIMLPGERERFFALVEKRVATQAELLRSFVETIPCSK